MVHQSWHLAQDMDGAVLFLTIKLSGMVHRQILIINGGRTIL